MRVEFGAKCEEITALRWECLNNGWSSEMSIRCSELILWLHVSNSIVLLWILTLLLLQWSTNVWPVASLKKKSSTQPRIVLSHVDAISFFPLLQFLFLANSLTSFVDSLERGAHKTHPVWLIPLSFSATYVHPAQIRVPGMTDVLLGMLAERKCLEKGGGSPKRNTEALSCFCRTATVVPCECHEVCQLKEYQVRVRAQPEKYLQAKTAARGYSALYCLAYKWPPNVQVPPQAWISNNNSCAHWDACA